MRKECLLNCFSPTRTLIKLENSQIRQLGEFGTITFTDEVFIEIHFSSQAIPINPLIGPVGLLSDAILLTHPNEGTRILSSFNVCLNATHAPIQRR